MNHPPCHLFYLVPFYNFNLQAGSSSWVIAPPCSASSAISANFPPTNYELDHKDQPEPLAPNTNQMSKYPPPNSEYNTVPWILTSRELCMPKEPMDFKLITYLADLRCHTDSTSSISSPSQVSLALLGSSVSLMSSTFYPALDATFMYQYPGLA